MLIFILILTLVIAFFAVIFALQNTTTVPIAFLFWHTEGSLALLLLLSLGIGVIIGLLAAAPGIIKRSRRISAFNKQLKELEKELQQHEDTITELKTQIPSKEPIEVDNAEIITEPSTEEEISSSIDNKEPDSDFHIPQESND